MKKSIVTICAFIALSFFYGCAKDPITGPAGPAGAAGKDGNANVVAITSTTVSTWTYDSTNKSYIGIIKAPAITQAIVDKGSVQVFENHGSIWVSLPDAAGSNTNNMTFAFLLGNVAIVNVNTNGTVPPNPGVHTFRVVVTAASN
jgi:hypothetical protein